jgi:hypothetical protein
MPKSLKDAMLMSKKKQFGEIHLNSEVRGLIKELFLLQIEAELFLKELKKKCKYRKGMFREIFEMMDVDNNGFVTLNEVK